jgi:hypothetical protein
MQTCKPDTIDECSWYTAGIRTSSIGAITHFEDVVVPTLHESVVLYVFRNNEY